VSEEGIQGKFQVQAVDENSKILSESPTQIVYWYFVGETLLRDTYYV
jgi:hypothetical protein